MSAKVSGLVWEVGPMDRNQRFVLLAIADNAGDDGYAFPSIKLLAAKCLFTDRYVIATLQALEKDHWLKVNRKARNGKGSDYNVNVERLEDLKHSKHSHEKSSREASSREQRSREIQRTSQVNCVAVSREIYDIPIRKNRHEPSLEPSPFASSDKNRSPQPGVFDLPLIDKTIYSLPQELFSEYVKAYPAIGVMEELGKMRAWCLSNPKNKKTRNGITRFIASWLGRAQDKAPANGNGNGHGKGRDIGAEMARLDELLGSGEAGDEDPKNQLSKRQSAGG